MVNVPHEREKSSPPCGRLFGRDRWLPLHDSTIARLLAGGFVRWLILTVADGSLVAFAPTGEVLEVWP